MRLQRFGTFTGGIDLPEEKASTRDRPIAPLALPARLVVPTDPCRLGGAAAQAVVGQRVRPGQRIALAGGRMPIFAPVGGVVTAVSQCRLAGGPEGDYDSPAIEIGELEAPPPRPPNGGDSSWRDSSPDALLAKIAEGGLTTFEGPLRRLADWLDHARASRVDTLLANGLENQPYLTAEHRLLAENGEQVLEGLAILARTLAAKRVALAVDSRRTGDYGRIDKPSRRLNIQPLAVEHKYPIGHPVLLTAVLTGRKTPPGSAPTAVRVAVVNVAACLAVWEWVCAGLPPTHRVVTVAGRDVARPGNYLAPFGMAATDVLAQADLPGSGDSRAGDSGGERVICHGGPMTGGPLGEGVVVGPATVALLSLPAAQEDGATACIRCAWCTDQCPVRLNVANLNDLYELGLVDQARRCDVAACIGCGVCSYVCPARLPLTHRMRRLKQAVQAARTGDTACPQATRRTVPRTRVANERPA
jgi:electron transport complex protein RnfC